MADGNSLINLGELSKPATILIERISDAIGCAFEPQRIRRKAAADADASIIMAQTEIEITDIQRRAARRWLAEESRKQENIEAIAGAALADLSSDSDPSRIETDWLTQFFDSCRNVSNSDMQRLWSSVLAMEANQPGSVSKKSVLLLQSMSKEDAELFSRLCQFVWYINGLADPVIPEPNAKLCLDQGISFTACYHMADLGLVQFEPLAGFSRLSTNYEYLCIYARQRVLLHPDSKLKVDLGHVQFTLAGRQLFPVTRAKGRDSVYEETIKYWMDKGLRPNSSLDWAPRQL